MPKPTAPAEPLGVFSIHRSGRVTIPGHASPLTYLAVRLANTEHTVDEEMCIMADLVADYMRAQGQARMYERARGADLVHLSQTWEPRLAPLEGEFALGAAE